LGIGHLLAHIFRLKSVIVKSTQKPKTYLTLLTGEHVSLFSINNLRNERNLPRERVQNPASALEWLVEGKKSMSRPESNAVGGMAVRGKFPGLPSWLLSAYLCFAGFLPYFEEKESLPQKRRGRRERRFFYSSQSLPLRSLRFCARNWNSRLFAVNRGCSRLFADFS
jgi:hypothetical protein